MQQDVTQISAVLEIHVVTLYHWTKTWRLRDSGLTPKYLPTACPQGWRDRGGEAAAATVKDRSKAQPLGLADSVSRVWCWSTDSGNSTTYIEQGSLWQIGFAESFKRQYIDKLLNTELFATVAQAKSLANRRRWECNNHRPPLAHQGRTTLVAARGAAACPPLSLRLD